MTDEDQPPEVLEAFELSKRTPEPIWPRSRAEITAYFGDFALVEPGVVHIPLWRPDDPAEVGEHPERINALAAAQGWYLAPAAPPGQITAILARNAA